MIWAKWQTETTSKFSRVQRLRLKIHITTDNFSRHDQYNGQQNVRTKNWLRFEKLPPWTVLIFEWGSHYYFEAQHQFSKFGNSFYCSLWNIWKFRNVNSLKFQVHPTFQLPHQISWKFQNPWFKTHASDQYQGSPEPTIYLGENWDTRCSSLSNYESIFGFEEISQFLIYLPWWLMLKNLSISN